MPLPLFYNIEPRILSLREGEREKKTEVARTRYSLIEGIPGLLGDANEPVSLAAEQNAQGRPCFIASLGLIFLSWILNSLLCLTFVILPSIFVHFVHFVQD